MIADPIRLQQFLSAATAAVTVDRGFDLVRLAQELRGIRPSDVTFTTVPLSSMNYVTPTGQSAVLWNRARAAALFSWLKTDAGTSRQASSRRSHSKAPVTRAQVSVDVYNGTMISGLSTATGTQLANAGFSVHKAGLNWTVHNVAQDADRVPARPGGGCPPARQGRSRSRAACRHAGSRASSWCSGPPRTRSRLPRPAGTQPAASPTGTASQSRTAAQDACR